MWACIPVILFIFFLLFLKKRESPSAPVVGWRSAFLYSTVLWGLSLLIVLEILSVFQALELRWLVIGWLFPTFVGGLHLYREEVWIDLAGWSLEFKRFLDQNSKILVLGSAAILLTLLGIALFSPPNSNDSLLYHMTRVAHWAQNRSLNHFHTEYIHNVVMPPFAEMAILNFYILARGDQLSNLIQWFSYLGSIVGVSAIAGIMGLDRRYQWLAAILAMSVPMGILQATSTQNDLVATFWTVILAYFVILSQKRMLTKFELFLMASSLGLGALTKATFYVYAFPFILWYSLGKLKNRQARTLLGEGLVILTLFVGINSTYWARNIQTFGGPFGPAEWLERNLEITTSSHSTALTSIGTNAQAMENPDVLSISMLYENQTGEFAPISLKKFLLPLIKAILQNFGTPFPSINVSMTQFAENIFREELNPQLVNGYLNHEDLAGNPIHLSLIPLTGVILILKRRQIRNAHLVAYSLSVLAVFLLLPYVLSLGDDLYGVRFQLPVYVLWAPLTAIAIVSLGFRYIPQLAASCFLILAIPWIFFNRTRPLVPHPTWTALDTSILASSQNEILFANHLGNLDEFEWVAKQVLDSDCNKIGLILEDSTHEYLYWGVLEPLQNNLRVERLRSIPELERFVDLTFKPCLVICTICNEAPMVEELPLIASADQYRIYSDFVHP